MCKHALLKGIEEEAEKHGERISVMIKGARIDKFSTLKTFAGHIDDHLQDDEDYYNGKRIKEDIYFNTMSYEHVSSVDNLVNVL